MERSSSYCRCYICDIEFRRKLSEQGKNNFCSKECYLKYKSNIHNSSEMKINRYVKRTWTNLNIRAGKYRNNSKKNKAYLNIEIEFTRSQWKEFCHFHRDKILSLSRPSIDRIDSMGNYTLDNIQFIELRDNIIKDKTSFTMTHGVCYSCKETKEIESFCKDGRRANGRATLCKACEAKIKAKRYILNKRK